MQLVCMYIVCTRDGLATVMSTYTNVYKDLIGGGGGGRKPGMLHDIVYNIMYYEFFF